MAKSDNQNVKSQANWHKIDNAYLEVYITHLVKRFRYYNNDEFAITISGLNKFIDNDDKILTDLLTKLRQNNFNLLLEGVEDNINQINVVCRNITAKSPYDFTYQIQNLVSIVEFSSKTDIPIVGILIMKIVAQIITKTKILYKAIVLDLDDTLWPGTLLEVGPENIDKNLTGDRGIPFIAFMKFLKALADELGIFIAICSRNNLEQVERVINQLSENIFPLKNQIDFIVANDNDKSDNIKNIAKELGILADFIVFIDDNEIVRDEVKKSLPNVFVPEWSNHDELVNQLISGCIFDRIELSVSSKNRRKQFKTIQTERTQNSLPALLVKIIKDKDHVESIKLYSKSNQFKTSDIDTSFAKDAESLYFEIYRENGEGLGICSTITYTLSDDTITLVNWAISCRYFQIGVEEFILLYLQKTTNKGKVSLTFKDLGYNLKAKEMLQKYCTEFKNGSQDKILSIIFNEETVSNLSKNTNLREVLNG